MLFEVRRAAAAVAEALRVELAYAEPVPRSAPGAGDRLQRRRRRPPHVVDHVAEVAGDATPATTSWS